MVCSLTIKNGKYQEWSIEQKENSGKLFKILIFPRAELSAPPSAPKGFCGSFESTWTSFTEEERKAGENISNTPTAVKSQ